ncbi:ABC transporter permease [Candidatus Bipolaricaulota bacterium]
MTQYILRRLLLLIPTLLGVTVLTFVLGHVVPADPARLALGIAAPETQVIKYREEHGLNDPIYVQYFRYMGNFLKGDLGVSLTSRRPVADDVRDYWPATVELVLLSLLIAFPIGISLGILASIKPNSFFDHASRVLSILGVSIPIFWLGIVFLIIFYVKIPLYPGIGRITPSIAIDHPFIKHTGLYLIDTLIAGQWPSFFSALSHLFLPAVCLALSPIARLTRITRASMLTVLGEDYVRVARSKGLRERLVIIKHVLRNALTPVLTTSGLIVGYALAGSVLVETIFSWPGLGTYAFKAASGADYPAVMGVALLTTAVFILANLITDISYAIADPRVVLD